MCNLNLQNALIMFLKNREVLGFTIGEAFRSVQEHETNVLLILKEVHRCVFSLDISFGDFSHKSILLRQYSTVFC